MSEQFYGAVVAACSDHRPVQHRDGRPPWCPKCGMDANGRPPPDPFRPATAAIQNNTLGWGAIAKQGPPADPLVKELTDTFVALYALHAREGSGDTAFCVEDKKAWPCPTVTILEASP